MQKERKGKLSRFLRENTALIIILVCILAISGIVIGAGISNPKTPPITDGSNNNKPTPEPETPVVVPPISFELPTGVFTMGMEFCIDDFIKNITLNEWSTHNGVDLIVEANSKVNAIADGTVTKITNSTGMGTSIEITHADKYRSVYSSLSSDVLVAVGDKVTKGSAIGLASDSAYDEFKQGAHVHLEVYLNDKIINPNTILNI